MEALLTLSAALAFVFCVYFGLRSSFRLFRGFAGSTVAMCDRSSVSGPNFRANEASYALIAAIMAGMPIRFMTRAIL